MSSLLNRGPLPLYARAIAVEDGPLERHLDAILARQEHHDLSPARVVLARELTRNARGLDDDERAAALLLVLALMRAERAGSTCLPLTHEALGAHLDALFGEGSPLTLQQQILTFGAEPRADLIGARADYRPLILDDGRLYLQRMHHDEQRLAERLRARMRAAERRVAPAAARAALADVLDHMPELAPGQPMSLNPAQQFALLSALHRPLSLISGGPGTGKTTLIVSLVRLATRMGYDPESIALAAPTGKAARRMSAALDAQLLALPAGSAGDEALGGALATPRTLHRLLAYSPSRRRFHYHRDNPLSARLVIVDEASMIDLRLMDRLLDATSPSANLVLVGDADQLPPVGAGAVFRDLIPPTCHTDTPWRLFARDPLSPQRAQALGAHHAVRLRRSYRMDEQACAGAAILRVAHAVRAGEPVDDRALTSTPLADLSPSPRGACLVEPGRDALTPARIAEWWYRTTVALPPAEAGDLRRPFVFEDHRFDAPSHRRLTLLFEHHSRAQLLTVTRVLPTGSDALNRHCHALHARRHGLPLEHAFAVGEPVMMGRNDYRRGIFNGDQGLLLFVSAHGREARPMVVFQRAGHFVPFSLRGLLADLDLAHAITVHKSQGSEFESVGLVLPDQAIPLLGRELLYTGLTRASDSVVIFGERAVFNKGAAHSVTRNSGLPSRLGPDVGDEGA